MSNQLQITGGAKVRNLEGVLTGTSGVVSALGINVPSGIPQLDGSGKILVSQLPNSVMEYKGTWNVATNTPYLVDGVGNAGDVYIVTGAATGGTSHNFGAGPITFYNGDQAIYDGSLWQRASGSTGSVTSVAMTTPTGLTVTGSPITTSGTLALSLSSGYTIPTTSFLSGLVPYTGATQTVDLGSYDLNARGIKINGTSGLGHADFKHQSGTPTGSASSTTLFADTNGNMAWKNDHNYITTLASNANTADRTYTFPDANGTIALTSNLTSYVPYSGATTNVNLGSYGLSGNGDFVMGSVKSAGIFAESGAGAAGYLYLKGDSSFGLLSGYNSIFANGFKYGFEAYGGSSLNSKRAYLDFGSLTNNTTRTYTFPNASGTIALTSDIPSLTGYVPYTGATGNVDLGAYTIKSTKIFGEGTGSGTSGILAVKNGTGIQYESGYTVLSGGTYTLNVSSWVGSATQAFTFDFGGLSTARTYTMPNATGTLALTSDIPSLANYVTLNTTQTISGAKTFSADTSFTSVIFGTNSYFSGIVQATNGLVLPQSGSRVTGSGLTTISVSGTNGFMVGFPSGNFSAFAFTTSANNTYTFPNRTGTIATLEGAQTFTGAATFSSSVTAGGLITGQAGIYQTNASLTIASNKFETYNGGATEMNFSYPASGAVNFQNGNSRLYINSSGNVGIGTGSPTGAAGLALVLNSGANQGRICLKTSSTGDGSGNGFQIGIAGTSAFIEQRENADLTFATNASERMRITSGGDVSIGLTSAPGKFNVKTTVAQWAVVIDQDNPGTQYIQLFRYNTSAIGNIAGNNTSVSYATSSDYRLKQDLKDYNGLDILSRIKTYDFEWKIDNSRMYGVMAHELQDVLPYAVVGEKDGKEMQGVDYSKIVPVLVKAIQELKAEIDELKNK